MERQPRSIQDPERLLSLIQILTEVGPCMVAEVLRDRVDPDRVSGRLVLDAFKRGIEFALYRIAPVTITMPSGETLTFGSTQELVSTEEPDPEARDYYDKSLPPRVMDYLRKNLLWNSPDINDLFVEGSGEASRRAEELRALRGRIREE